MTRWNAVIFCVVSLCCTHFRRCTLFIGCLFCGSWKRKFLLQIDTRCFLVGSSNGKENKQTKKKPKTNLPQTHSLTNTTTTKTTSTTNQIKSNGDGRDRIMMCSHFIILDDHCRIWWYDVCKPIYLCLNNNKQSLLL